MRGLWCLEERLGMPLSQIHIHLGKVPHFKEKLERGVMNLFRRIQPNSPVQRNTWYTVGDDAINEEGFTLGAGEENKAVENFYFKTERQTVRRYAYSSQRSRSFLGQPDTVPTWQIATLWRRCFPFPNLHCAHRRHRHGTLRPRAPRIRHPKLG